MKTKFPKSTNLSAWLNIEQPKPTQSRSGVKLAPFVDVGLEKIKNQPLSVENNNSTFNPGTYFIPGWKGDSLVSKTGQQLNRIIDLIKVDCEKQFLNDQGFNRTLKTGIFNEFLAYAEHIGHNFDGLDNYTSFSKHLKDPNSSEFEALKKFVDLYTYRVAVIYFYKIRFISILSDKIGIELADRDLLNPNSFITSQFKSGSSTELKSQAILSNHYTWYRPMPELVSDLHLLKDTSKEISITEIVKNVSQKTENLLNDDAYYSHALSHKHFGLFLNSLLLNFPIWIEQIKNKSRLNLNRTFPLEAISSKYTGDYLESLSLSHWLAQENNKYLKWEQILCPDFKGSNFITGNYLKICNELQFLTFLALISDDQGYAPLNFICSVMNEKFQNQNANNSKEQANFLIESEVNYDRIVINLIYPPKNNPHHYLVAQIEKEGALLKEDGYLYVLTTQKLFVPSQREKVENLLKEFTLEGCVNFDELTGRGEVAPYIYIFSKGAFKHKNSFYAQNKKLPCLSFRVAGELVTFQNFTKITDELQMFYLDHLTDAPPLFQREISNEVRFEFYQDAIVEGRLINSSSKDSTKITHPNFFRNLTKSCLGFDNFFTVKNLGKESIKINSEFSIGQSAEDYPYLLIIDQRNPSLTRLELTTFDTYAGKVNEYGNSLCTYFGLIPKVSTINLNLFRYFFNSPLGLQMIELTFRGSESKYKSKLESLLVPKFFAESMPIPAHLEKCLELLKNNPDELIKKPIGSLKSQYGTLEPIIVKLLDNYPHETYGLLLLFHHHLEHILTAEHYRQSDQIKFNNQTLQEILSKLPTKPLYPQNSDVFVDFKITDRNELNLGLESWTVKDSTNGNVALMLIAQGKTVVEIHTQQCMSDFIQYIFSFAQGTPILRLLTAIHVPNASDLESTLAQYNQQKLDFKFIFDRLKNLLDQTLNQRISGKNL